MPSDEVERLRIESARQRTEVQLALGMSIAGVGVGAIDYISDSIVLDITAAGLFGLPAGTALPRKEIHARFHLDCAPKVTQLIAAALDPGGAGVMSVEFRVARPDGSEVWVLGRKQVAFSTPSTGGTSRATTGVFVVRDITQRKIAEDRLRVSEIRYRRLFEAAHDGVLLVDPATSKIVDANPFMSRLLGYPYDHLVGKELFEIGLLKDSAMSQDMVRKLKIDHHVRYEHLPLESDKGRHREVEVVANLYDENGSAIIQCNIRDITDRKVTEAAALQNSRLFSTLIEQAPSGVYVIDDGFRVLQVNRLAAPFFASVKPLHGRDFGEVLNIIWGPTVGLELASIFKHTLETGDRYSSAAFTARRTDIGVEQSYDWEVQRVTLADGNLGVVCYFNDVTARRNADADSAEREAHVRSILDNTQSFIGLLSVDGTLLEANAPALAAAGITRERVIGRKLWDTKWWTQNATEVARLKDAVARCARGETVRYDMVVRISGDVSMDIDFMLAPVRDASGVVTLLVPSGNDITERKRSMQKIQLLMGEVNHRSMNLLSVVQAVARQTSRDGDPETFVTRLTERIGSLAASQDLLVQNEWQGVEVANLVAAQLSHYKDLMGTRVMYAGPALRLTPAAAQGIGMALHELATNAGKYGALSKGEGRVDVSWRITTGAEPMFEMRWVEAGGPTIDPPTRKGFGQKVIGQMVEASVNGNADVDYRPTGLVWTLIAPISDTLERGRSEPPAPHVKP
ncbi:MAG: PAS domain S-box protein [Hyphomicrobiaceae bacterium]|nr:PAS domain S-box protein [Hyphomicrobiaceae bacterium]